MRDGKLEAPRAVSHVINQHSEPKSSKTWRTAAPNSEMLSSWRAVSPPAPPAVIGKIHHTKDTTIYQPNIGSSRFSPCWLPSVYWQNGTLFTDNSSWCLSAALHQFCADTFMRPRLVTFLQSAREAKSKKILFKRKIVKKQAIKASAVTYLYRCCCFFFLKSGLIVLFMKRIKYLLNSLVSWVWRVTFDCLYLEKEWRILGNICIGDQ